MLLPGASLGLRVFEPRYLDLVRECGRSGGGFGVCLILDGEEVGAPATSAAFGTEAVIEDFGSDDGGLLTLQVRGARRFRVQQRAGARQRPPGRRRAAGARPMPCEHAAARTRPAGDVAAEACWTAVGGEHAKAPSALLDDAAWVSGGWPNCCRWRTRNAWQLLQLDDPHQRLDRLLSLLP